MASLAQCFFFSAEPGIEPAEREGTSILRLGPDRFQPFARGGKNRPRLLLLVSS